MGYGISKGITGHFADKKILGILGNLTDNTKVNKRLAAEGFKNLKIGRDGFKRVYNSLYKNYGYDVMRHCISYSYDFITGFVF